MKPPNPVSQNQENQDLPTAFLLNLLIARPKRSVRLLS